MRKFSTWLLGALVITSFAGCSSSEPDVEVIDLNRVLDIMIGVLEKPADAAVAKKTEKKEVKADAKEAKGKEGADEGAEKKPGEVELQPVEPIKEDKAKQTAFLKQFADELNKAKLVKSPVGVILNGDGSVEGFTDNNKNAQKDAGEAMLFTVQVDAERSRLIASDGEHYRPAAYRPHFGFFSGYLLGSMLGRQNSFFSSGAKPNFGATQMSPSNYHSSAVTKARARVSSARGRTGSGGFSGGK